MSPRRFTRSPLLVALLAIPLGGLAVAWIGSNFLPTYSGLQRLVVVLEPVDQGVTPVELQGIRMVLGACVEEVVSVPVVEGERVPDASPGSTVLRLGARRRENGLELLGTIQRPGEGRVAFTCASPDPRQALSQLLERLHLRDGGVSRLLPRESRYLWPVLQAYGYRPGMPVPLQDVVFEEAIQAEPQVPLLWGALATVSHLTAIGSGQEGRGAALCESHFRKALELAPRSPVVVSRFAIHRAVHGEMPSALEVLIEARRHRPRSVAVLQSLSYVGRQVGLLEGARRALRARERAMGPLRNGSGFVENLYLYTGEWGRFEEALGTNDPRGNTYLAFYRGYIRLLQGRGEEADQHFKACGAMGRGAEEFAWLARILHLHLAGAQREAEAEALRLWNRRVPLRTADGEFTLKVAETLALLGLREPALDAAQRAFDQGFACTAWYQMSPFLKPLHTEPRWKALLQMMAARQAALEARFPAERFGS